MILAGDIGGTKTNLAFFEHAGWLTPTVQQRFDSKAYGSLDEIVQEFVTAHRLRAHAACFGVAGPVSNNRTVATNLPWEVDGARLASELGTPRVHIINDLEANAWGISVLGPGDSQTLQPGQEGAMGNAAIIAAGTGLGEAGLYWDGKAHRPFACEGGHCSFAPQDDVEIELLQWLKTQYEHVSWERAVSGMGIHNLYRFLRDTGRETRHDRVDDDVHAAEARGEDPVPIIARAAQSGECSLSERAIDWFVSLYGAEAGNLALKVMARGGLYIGGGVAPKLLPRLEKGGFLRAFNAKGRMQSLMESMPVHVILNEKTALLGAAVRARGES